MLGILPIEVIFMIVKYITDPKDYLSLRSINREMSVMMKHGVMEQLSNIVLSLPISSIVWYFDYTNILSKIRDDVFLHTIKREKSDQYKHIIDNIAHSGPLRLVVIMQENLLRDDMSYSHVISNACLAGHLNTVKYLHKKGYKLNHNCFMAAEYGHMPVVEYLHKHKCPYHINTMSQTCCYNNYDMVKWLLEHGYKGDKSAVRFAKKNGNQKLVDLLASHNITEDTSRIL